MSRAGGEGELLSNSRGLAPRWSRDGTQIYFIGTQRQAGNLWAFSLEDRSVRRLTDLRGRRGNLGVQGLTAGNQDLYFTWRDDLGDIWIMDVVK